MAVLVPAFAVIWKFKQHMSMVLVQICYVVLYFMVEAAFNQGVDPHVYVTYRLFIGSLVMLPFAYFLERKARPKLTFAMFVEMSVLSLLGFSLTVNMYFASLKYTSPTFVTAMVNIISSLTFIIAVTLRLEVVDVRNPRGIAKILGTLVSFAGVMVMTLYKGPAFQNWQGAPLHIRNNPADENWVKGPILAVVSCITWALWYILQAFILKKYPAQLSLTAWLNCIGGVQSTIFTVIVQHNPAAWLIKSSIGFWSIIYSGAVSCGLAIFLQLWCTKHKGPVFVTIFTPLSTIMVAVVAYFVVGEKLHLSSILGGGICIIGLYLFLWGKEGDQTFTKPKELTFLASEEQQKEPKVQLPAAAEREEP